MKILQAEIDMLTTFGRQYANKPSLRAIVDEEPKLEDLTWEQHEHGIWVGKHSNGILYRYLSHPGTDTNEGGYGGAAHTLKMVDGSTRTLLGPWSSGPYGVWFGAGLKLVDVSLKAKDSVYSVYFSGWAMTPESVVELVLPHLRPIDGPGFDMFQVNLVVSDPQTREDSWNYDFAIMKHSSISPGGPRILIDTRQQKRGLLVGSQLSAAQLAAATWGL